ncbi:MAG: hypothetical protein JWQ40_561 [Segetibacter sp.]|jgi:hypothetical protein|nr:hypothetical protein [Segetibacter sp.]
MNSCASRNDYKYGQQMMKTIFKVSNNTNESLDSTQPQTVEELQAKILELEKELKKQKQAAEKGAKLLKLIWGDQFATDSLH